MLHDPYNNSTMAVVDAANQSVKTGYGYSPFGLVFKTNTTSKNNLLFAGREEEGIGGMEGGIYYMRGRYCNADFHRFLSEDPIGFAGGDTNLHRYAGNRPHLTNDPTGLAGGEIFTSAVSIRSDPRSY